MFTPEGMGEYIKIDGKGLHGNAPKLTAFWRLDSFHTQNTNNKIRATANQQ